MKKVICFGCKHFGEKAELNAYYCDKVDFVLPNGFAMLGLSNVLDCYDENGELKSEQRKS